MPRLPPAEPLPPSTGALSEYTHVFTSFSKYSRSLLFSSLMKWEQYSPIMFGEGDQGKMLRILHMLDEMCYGGEAYFNTVQGGGNEVYAADGRRHPTRRSFSRPR